MRRLSPVLTFCAAMALAFTGLLLTGSPSVAEGAGGTAAQPTAAGHLLVYPDKSWASFPSLEKAVQAGDAAGMSVVTFYDWANYNSSGATLTYSVAKDCTPSTDGTKDYRFPAFPGGWNDTATSVTTRMGNGSHCDVWMSADVNFKGECGNEWIDQHWDLSQVPFGCNNKASSFELS
ncbi:hypothetical protein ABZX93_11520 [Streptomyces sp. NPDC006632]|uniref:hypothetical protein n=1 Tax=unclassified Streptomyces TaxID=2593676 RepID=UPI002E22862A